MMPDKAATPRTQTQHDKGRRLVKAVWDSGSGLPSCCGLPMMARLAQASDRYGQSFYVTVWSCAQCGKSVY